MALLFLSPDDPAEAWREALRRKMQDLDFRIGPEIDEPDAIDVALVWRPPPGELARYPNLRAILSLGAGIDGLLAQPGLPDVPIARMVDPSLTRTMTEYVLLATLRHHRQFDRFEREQRSARWSFALPPQAADRRVGVMGLGVLGSAAAACLAAHGFAVAGWSREAKQLPGVESFAGRAGLAAFLARTEILICLLPLTRDTVGILDATTFAGLPRGACLINVARGAHLVEADLIAALDSGQLEGATLDVFGEEPLPSGNPLLAPAEGADHASRRKLRFTMDGGRGRGREHSPGARRRAAAAPGRPRTRLLSGGRRPACTASPQPRMRRTTSAPATTSRAIASSTNRTTTPTAPRIALNVSQNPSWAIRMTRITKSRMGMAVLRGLRSRPPGRSRAVGTWSGSRGIEPHRLTACSALVERAPLFVRAMAARLLALAGRGG